MSGPRDFSVILVATVPSVVERLGRFFGIIDAPDAPLDVALEDGQFLRRGPGGSVYVPSGFERVTLLSSVNQTVRVLIADEPQDVSNIVTGSGGSPTVNVTAEVDDASDAIATPDHNAIAAGVTENIAANADRKRITIGVLSSAADSIFVQAVGSNDASGQEIVPGTNYRFPTRAALDIHALAAGGGSVYYVLEEE